MGMLGKPFCRYETAWGFQIDFFANTKRFGRERRIRY